MRADTTTPPYDRYVRTANPGSATGTHSIAEQRHAIERYAAAHGLELGAERYDHGPHGIDAASVAQLVDRVVTGLSSGFVVARTDRISRRPGVLLGIVAAVEAAGGSVHVADTDPAAFRVLLTVLGAVRWPGQAFAA